MGLLVLILTSYMCAVCGESNEVCVDPCSGSTQTYVEDCAVCCRPNTLRIFADLEWGWATVDATFEE